LSSYATQGAQVPSGEPATDGGMPESQEEPEAADSAEAPEAADRPEAADAPAAADAPEGAGSLAPEDIAHASELLPGDAAPLADSPDDDDDGPDDPGDAGPVAADEAPYSRPPVSKLAVFALVTGILPTVPVALVTGIAALVGIRRSGRRGHGMAVTALFLAVAWIIVGGAVGTVAVLTHGFKKPVKTIYHEEAVFRLRPGECIDIPNGGQPTAVSCTVPHDAEVFGTFTLPGSAWPGTAAVQQEAGAGCGTRLSAYLNPQLAISLAQTYVYPNEVDWTAGTRTVICEVRAASGQLSESVRGAGGS
jgi:putative regulator of septum formation